MFARQEALTHGNAPVALVRGIGALSSTRPAPIFPLRLTIFGNWIPLPNNREQCYCQNCELRNRTGKANCFQQQTNHSAGERIRKTSHVRYNLSAEQRK